MVSRLLYIQVGWYQPIQKKPDQLAQMVVHPDKHFGVCGFYTGSSKHGIFEFGHEIFFYDHSFPTSDLNRADVSY